MTEKSITRVSLEALRGRKGSSRPEALEGPELGPDFWERAQVVDPQQKKSVHLRVDADVLEFFKNQGKGHLTRMNAVLRAYVNAHR